MTYDGLDGLLPSIVGFGILMAILGMVAGVLLSGPMPKELKAAQARAIVKVRADAYDQALADCHDLQKEHHQQLIDRVRALAAGGNFGRVGC